MNGGQGERGITPDGPKWTARSVRDNWGGGQGWKRGA